MPLPRCLLLLTTVISGVLLAPMPLAADEGPAVAAIVADNPYGLPSLWLDGDPVTRGTLVLLAMMSIASWSILLARLIDQARLFRQARRADDRFWATTSTAEGLASLSPGSPFHSIAASGLKAVDQHRDQVVETVDLHTWVSLALQRTVGTIVGQLQSGLAVLASVGSTAPFVGLFGTVWAIYHALIAIGIAGQASIDKVAGPVGQALIMTALGLAVAVPAVLGYNLLVRRNRLAADAVRGFASDLHVLLLARVPRAPSTEAR